MYKIYYGKKQPVIIMQSKCILVYMLNNEEFQQHLDP